MKKTQINVLFTPKQSFADCLAAANRQLLEIHRLTHLEPGERFCSRLVSLKADRACYEIWCEQANSFCKRAA